MPHGTDLRSSGIRLLAVAVAFVVVGVASPGVAQTCIVTTPIGVDDTGTAIAVQSDGKIVLGGYARIGGNDDFAVVRYNPDFSLDLSFGTNGIVTMDFFAGQDRVEAIAIQPDAKIVVAGHATNVTRDFAIARYNLDGTLDSTFGTLGKATSDITGNNDEIEGVAVDATGRIVVAGFSQNATLDYVVARYDATGSLDTAGFASPNGYFVSTNGATNDVATAVAIQPSDGNIVLGGWANNGANDDFSAVRFDVNGAIDPSFGGGPVLVPVGANRDRAFAMTLQADGKVLLAGAARVGFDAFAVVRLNTNGTVDTATFNPAGAFGGAPNVAGKVTTAFTGLHDSAYGVVEQTDNKIVVVGWANWDGGGSNVDFALARYNADGSLDGGFSGGTVTTAVGANNDWIDSVALQPDGKIVVGGYSGNGSDDDFAAARYNTDGSLDTSCSGACTPLTTSEGAGTITVTASGRFEMRFNTATGGAVDQFFDLAEDPARTYDLAGGITDVLSLYSEKLRVSSVWYGTDQNNLGSKVDLLEATPTRVRTRQEAFFQENSATNILAGPKGLGDYSIYPSGKMAIKWTRQATSAVPVYERDELTWAAHYQNVAPLDTWARFSDTSGGYPHPPTDAFALLQTETADARNDFLNILYRDWTTANGYLESADQLTISMIAASEISGERRLIFWRELTGAIIGAGSSETWNFLTHFKPTNLVDELDPAVTGRRDDYRGPSSLSVMIGGPWLDPSENTGGGDDFNEAEAAYPLTFDPALGLRFDIDGGTTRRYSPFFKIRQWRSLQDPQVTLGGTTLANDVDFKADVKPIARSRFANGIRFHSTLEVAGSVTNPDIGDGTGSTVSGPSFTAARYGQGARFAAATDFIDVPLISGGQNIELDRGRIEFWYQPAYAHDDGVEHYLFDLGNNGGLSRIRVVKQNGGSSNQLLYEVVDLGGTPHQAVIASTDYSWRTNDWVHLAFTWDRSDATDNVKAYLNGTSLVPQSISNGTFSMEAEDPLGAMRLGNRIVGGTSTNADGIFDEWFIHQEEGTDRLAHGGLESNSFEYLADASSNYQLNFFSVDANQRGQYWFVGLDSKFRGINVALATRGVGSSDLVWEYWNGTAWTDLEVGFGFTDETNHLTADGTIYWTGDPFGWSPLSLSGGPDLYYVRTSIDSASPNYTTRPVEAIVKSDILLFQYCGDITTAAQPFDFAVPTPTAVELVFFEARAVHGAVELGWETASELNNLGFHVYRSTTSEGAYKRVTARAIPGLGSSPVGARYSYRDTGLTNGVTYYYKLEDIETTGRTEFHGPVSATPVSADSGAGGESESSPNPSSRESLITYGDPSANSLRVLQRSSRQVVLELVTKGFYAEPQEDGSVRLEVPGFASLTEAPGIPVKRTWVEAVAGRKVTLASVQAHGVEAFASLRPSGAEVPEIVATSGGAVRVARRRTRKAFRGEGVSPSSAAQIVSVGFQGDVKKALVELAPLRWDGTSGQLLLARRLVVRVSFSGRESSELASGRAYTKRRSHDRRNVVVHLATQESGLYSIRFENVMRGRRGVRAKALRLSRQGETVPFHLEPNRNRFQPGSTLYFVSEGARANPFGSEAVYELEVGARGEAMAEVSAAPSGEIQPAYWHRAEWEENRYYQAALVDAPDLWLWDLLFAPETKSYPIEVSAIAPGASKLSVWMQGASDFPAEPDHHVRVFVNGTLVEELSWDGKQAKHLDVELAPGVLREGDNVLVLENVGDTEASYSMVMLDRYAVEYPRLAHSSDGRLEGRWNGAGTAELSRLAAGTHVLDTSETAPRWLVDTELGADGKLRFHADAGRSYLAVSPEAVYHPAVTTAKSSRLKNARHRADYLLIAPEAFLQATIPLLEQRRGDGLKVKAVSIEEIYSEFGFGEPTPEAVKDFLSYAYHHWRQPSPRYVLLVGDGTYDFKDYLQTGVTNQVPPRMVKTSYLWTASDPSYAMVNGDDLLPDLAIGRLPAATVEEVQAMVEKIVAYETGDAGVHRAAVVLVADNPDRAGNFEADANELAAAVLASRNPEKIFLSQLGTAATRNSIVQAFDEGASLMSYMGHGGIHLWADENFFNAGDVASLGPEPQQPLLLTMNCLNGYFHFPYFDSLAEALLQARDKGAIAAFSPSGLSLNGPASLYHRALLDALVHGGHERLGDAVLEAQKRYAEAGSFPELLSIYHLLGDPALKLR